MIGIKDINKFWRYINNCFDAEEIDYAIEKMGFEINRLDNREWKKLSDEELKGLYGDMVYMVLNELSSGDFETMYDVLSENMGLSQEDISYLLDY